MSLNLTQELNNIDLQEFLHSGAILRENPEYCWLYYRSLKNENINEISIGYADFFDGKMRGLVFQKGPIKVPLRDLQSWLTAHADKMSGATRIIKKDFQKPNFEGFQESFQVIKSKIQREEIEKAVPVASVQSQKIPSLADRQAWLISLLKLPPELFIYGVWNNEGGLLGATPEILFRQKKDHVKTVALAGTCPRDHEEVNGQKLLNDKKERYEHQLVVDDLVSRLETIGWVKKHETKVLQLPKLNHLVTEIIVEGSSKTAEELIRLLHPTPALGVAPRSYGFRWMQELPDQAGRAQMGAPLLYSLPENDNICLVAIRNIQWSTKGENKASVIYAGCGVVKESQLEKEWQEIQYKLNSIFDSLGIES